MIYALISLSVLSAGLLVLTDRRERTRQAERDGERTAFASEREAWAQERQDLYNRIQIPEAAPFMEIGAAPSVDDLPVLPDFTVDSDELQMAKAELEKMGYESGPAL